MTLQEFTYEGTDGASLVQAGMVLNGAGTAVHSAADKMVATGSTGARFTANDATTRAGRHTINSSKIQAWDVWLKTPAETPTAGNTYQMLTLRHSGGTICIIEYNSAQTIAIYETAGAVRNNIPSAVVANSTGVRVQVKVNIGVATNDSTLEAKAYSSASNWSTQLGTTLTRSAINLGTVNAVAMDVGALTSRTPGLSVGVDNLRVDDGRTTDMPAPPTASNPSITFGSTTQYPEEDTVVNFNYTGSTAGSGSITNYLLAATAWPDGAVTPAITGSTTSTPSFTPTSGGWWEFDATITQTGGLTATQHYIVYAHAHSNADVLVRRVIDPGGWTLGGTGAASLKDALNSSSTANWAESPTSPVAGQQLIFEMDPFGPGPLSGFSIAQWVDSALDLIVGMYLENGTTLVQGSTFDLSSVSAEYETAFDSGDLATASEGAGRRALIVKVGAQA